MYTTYNSHYYQTATRPTAIVAQVARFAERGREEAVWVHSHSNMRRPSTVRVSYFIVTSQSNLSSYLTFIHLQVRLYFTNLSQNILVLVKRFGSTNQFHKKRQLATIKISKVLFLGNVTPLFTPLVSRCKLSVRVRV